MIGIQLELNLKKAGMFTWHKFNFKAKGNISLVLASVLLGLPMPFTTCWGWMTGRGIINGESETGK